MKNKTLSKVLIASMGVGLIGYAGGKAVKYQNKNIVSTEYKLRSEKLPKGFNGFKVAQVSDLQSQYFGKDQCKLIKAVEKGKPDIIVITGDLLDKRHTNFMASIKAISGLVKIAPVYFTNGNHELGIMPEQMDNFYQEMIQLGVHNIINSVEKIQRGIDEIKIFGFDEENLFSARDVARQFGKKYKRIFILEKLYNLAENVGNGFNIMITHEPQFIQEYSSINPDLILSGHAHGGQFRLPGGQGLYSPGQGVLPKVTSGLHVEGRSVMLVSRGLGNSRFPLRINNPPEVTFITLEKAD